MKLFLYFLLGFLVSSNAHGQNCKKLDAQTFFTTIQFGRRIPPALTLCAKQSNKVTTDQYSLLRLEYDSLQQACRRKYNDLFTFLAQPFSFSQIGTNEKGQILSVEFYSFFNEHNETATSRNSPLPGFHKLYKTLRSLYGEPTQVELPTRTDSLLMKERGMEQSALWACSTIDLKLRVYFGAPQKGLNVLHVSIRNRDFDLPLEELLLH